MKITLTKPQLKVIAENMTKREPNSYSFPLGKKGYKTKQQLILSRSGFGWL